MMYLPVWREICHGDIVQAFKAGCCSIDLDNYLHVLDILLLDLKGGHTLSAI